MLFTFNIFHINGETEREREGDLEGDEEMNERIHIVYHPRSVRSSNGKFPSKRFNNIVCVNIL